MFYLAALFLFLSGAASLVYQVAWVRLLSLSIGSTSVSVGLVLATFFLGLALGSYLTTRLPARRLTTLTPYLILEALIGLSAILSLPVLLNLDHLIATVPLLGQLFIFKVVLVVLILALPSICIGATYPLMVSLVVREQASIGQRLGWLYSLNTAGAVAGAAGVGFLLIPWWGLDGAIYFACGLNAIVVALGLVFKSHFTLPALPSAANPPADSALTLLDKKLLLVLLICGIAALASQVAWTKYLAIFVHTTIYGFSALLSIVLLGIALGAWWMKRWVDRLTHPVHWVIILLFGLALALLLGRSALQYLPTWYRWLSGSPDNPADQLIKYVLITLILLPPNMLFGALFTVNMRLFCGPLATLHRRAGSAYAANTLGGVIGSLLAGLWLIPVYGSDWVLVLMTALIAFTLLLFLQEMTRLQRQWLTVPITLALLMAALYGPALDFRQIITSSLYYFDADRNARQAPEFRFIEEGRSSVISVTTYNSQQFRLQSNSLAEAIVTPPDPFPWVAESLLGLLPYLLHPKPEEIFIVGLGAGTTLSATTLAPASSIRVVELEPAVERANHAMFQGGLPALGDPRVELTFGDARHRLLVDKQHYDVIISQPSHPWLMGSSNLFTREYFQLLSSRLKPGGISVQWVNLFNMDSTTLKSILQAYFNIFPRGMTFVIKDERSLLLVGSNEPLYFDPALIDQRLRQTLVQNALGKWKIHNLNDLLGYFALSRSDALRAAANSRENTDTSLIPEVRLSRATTAADPDEPLKFLLEHFSFDIVHYLKPGQREQTLEEITNHLREKRDRFRLGLLRKQQSLSTGNR